MNLGWEDSRLPSSLEVKKSGRITRIGRRLKPLIYRTGKIQFLGKIKGLT